MDRKTIIVLVCCVAGTLALFKLTDKLLPPIPVPPAATNAVPTGASSNVIAGSTETVAAAVTTPAVPLPTFATNLEEQILVATNQSTRFTFTSHGGGLKQLEFFN